MMSFREQMIAEAKKIEEHGSGTYIGANVSAKSRRELAAWANNYNIPHAADPKQYHTTIIYSRKGIPDVKKYNFTFPIRAKITGFEIFKNGDKNCLVATVDSDQLDAHHNAIRSLYGATHDFPNYSPHITLSYDYGDQKVPQQVPDISIEYTTVTIEPLDPEYTA